MSEVVPPIAASWVDVMVPVVILGIGIAVALALLSFIANLIVNEFSRSIDRDDHRLDRNVTADMLETWAQTIRSTENSKHEEKSKLKNDDLEFEGEDYFEDDEYASFEELLAEKPKRKNDDYE